MLPDSKILLENIQELQYPNETYRIDDSLENTQRIDGLINDLDSVEQAIYLILNTERYEHIIYSWDYGIELVDLIGKTIPYHMSEIPRRVEEALKQDDRVKSVKDFEFKKHKNQLEVSFTVVTNIGEVGSRLEVTI